MLLNDNLSEDKHILRFHGLVCIFIIGCIGLLVIFILLGGVG